ncbi:ATP-dependent nuclease [Sulfurimonas sp. ST-25]|uniref:ATP-dependent nuclease n=1 Tax=Sulfurimonas sp. ST-25 TaxID=3400151 RepID=UPI003A88C896
MRLIHYLEIENFKRFGEKQRIDLDHPSVIIGPNNSGKTSSIQAIALWSQAIKSWYDARKGSSATKRTSTPINRLEIVSVPVQTTKYFWSNTQTRSGNQEIYLEITLGIEWKEEVIPVTMRFRNQGNELVYATPDEETLKNHDLLEHLVKLNVELLYPMSGLETEEPILQPLHINDLMGQGRTAQVLRNLCLMVYKNSKDDWGKVSTLINRLFHVELGIPKENARGKIELFYTQSELKEPLEISMSGRGFQQMLLMFAYLYSHKNSVLLVDEPDAHLEILRQKQVYVLLRDIASENNSQVVIVTHSEVILDEALDNNLTLLISGKSDDLAAKCDIKNTLKHFGTEHYIKALERGYVFYVEGSTDVDMLRALAKKIEHPINNIWDEQLNVYYVQDNYPVSSNSKELERVEGGFGITPKKHFFILRELISGLKGLAILDNDGKGRQSSNDGGLNVQYWTRYEAENYFITPKLLKKFAREKYADTEEMGLFAFEDDVLIDTIMDDVILEKVFLNNQIDFNAYKGLEDNAARLVWEAKTEKIKLSSFAEEYYRKLSAAMNAPILLRKGEFHLLVEMIDATSVTKEVEEKLDLLMNLFE